MNKIVLVKKVAEENSISVQKATQILNSFLKGIMEAAAEGDKARLGSFGTFDIAFRKERVTHNPQTREEIFVPAHYAPVFRPGPSFRSIINKPKT